MTAPPGPTAVSDLFAQLQSALGETYRLAREITGGGMSRLFLATEASLERQVVVKVLPPDFASAMSAARFKREIELTAHLQHPHILPVLTAGAREGLLYYVMPFVAGESLRHRIDAEGPMQVGEACRILREVADALAYAHTQGVVHRDIKPENILLQGNHAVLADFGVAGAIMAAQGDPRSSSVSGEAVRLTTTGMSVGSPAYMAPEQLAAERDIDGRADIYSLGMVGYEMLVGHRPFEGLSGQALLVAQLTESPEPVSGFRPDVPPEMLDAIDTAMAKAPDERYQWAAEFHDALEGVTVAEARSTTREKTRGTRGTTRKVRVRPTVRTIRRRRFNLTWVTLGGLITASVAGGTLFWTLHKQEGLTPNLVAVAPFYVLYPPAEVWKEGLVDVFSRNLDIGPLKTVSPTVAVRRWSEFKKTGSSDLIDKTVASAFARKMGAQYVVYGSLNSSGRNAVLLKVSLLDVATGALVGGDEIRRSGSLDDMDDLADSVTVTLLRSLAPTQAIGASRGGSLGTRSIEALKPFLEGEQYYRRSQWDSAVASYERAVAADSTFALAYRHMGLAITWERNVGDSLPRAFLLRAGAFNRRLPTRDSLLVLADSIRSAMELPTSDPSYLSRGRRLNATLEEATRRYPGDPEVWYALGEARYHFPLGPAGHASTADVLNAFARSIQLDSAFAPAYIHAVELGFTLYGADSGLAFARRYLALSPRDVEGVGVRLVAQVAGARKLRSAEVQRMLDTVPADILLSAWVDLRHWPDEEETAVELARKLLVPRGGSKPNQFDSLYLSSSLAYRGRLAEAYQLLPNTNQRLFAELAMLGAIPQDRATAVFAGWLQTGDGVAAYALPWWAAQGDAAAIRSYLQSQEVGRTFNRRTGGHAPYHQLAAQAYLSLALHDTVAARRQFRALPDTLCLGCYADRLTKARVLASSSDANDLRLASAVLDERLTPLLTPLDVAFAYERGRVAERTGQATRAAAAYGLVASAWRNADPVLAPQPRAATVALAKLRQAH